MPLAMLSTGGAVETMNGRPAWQVEPCPTWCVVLHEDGDHEHDRHHMSAGMTVPARQLRTTPQRSGWLFGEEDEPAGPGGERTVSADLAVCLHRADGGPTTWLYVGDGEDQSLELTVDSWARLAPALDRMLESARA